MTRLEVYVFESVNECARLEAQARIADIERHLEYVKVPEYASILDAGCGSGSMSRLLARYNPLSSVTGVDINPEYINQAHILNESNVLKNLFFRTANLQTLPFEDNMFDLIWSKYVLCFLNNPALVVSEFFRVTKTGGSAVVVLNDWSRLTLHPADDRLFARIQRVVEGLADISLPARLPELLTNAGFVDISIRLEADRVYTFTGPMDQPRRQNHLIEMNAARLHIINALGSENAFDEFMSDWFDYLDRVDTSIILPLWFVSGTVLK